VEYPFRSILFDLRTLEAAGGKNACEAILVGTRDLLLGAAVMILYYYNIV